MKIVLSMVQEKDSKVSWLIISAYSYELPDCSHVKLNLRIRNPCVHLRIDCTGLLVHVLKLALFPGIPGGRVILYRDNLHVQ